MELLHLSKVIRITILNRMWEFIFLQTLKGLAVIGKFIVVKGFAAKVGLVAVHAINTFGLSAVIGNVLLAGTVAGGISWTEDRINNLKKGLEGLEDGNMGKAVRNFCQLALSINVAPEFLPEVVYDRLVASNIAGEKAQVVAEAVRNLEGEIANKISELG